MTVFVRQPSTLKCSRPHMKARLRGFETRVFRTEHYQFLAFISQRDKDYNDTPDSARVRPQDSYTE